MLRLPLYAILSLLFLGCKDKFTADLPSTQKNILVVEGNLAPAGAATVINLTRSYNLTGAPQPKPVLQAQLNVEARDNSMNAVLPMTAPGVYSAQLNILAGKEYRLRIRTTDGRIYFSDFVVARISPPIDSISWERFGDDVRVYANTKDPSNNSRYYQWDFDETWEIRSHYRTEWKFQPPSMVVPRAPTPEAYICWKFSKSNSILIASSAQLSNDVIHKAPLITVPRGSERLSVRYSVLARQKVISKDGYDYLQVMRRNTETLGSIFDAQPSELKGNINCTSHPDEQVIGFLTASSITEKRMFLSHADVPWADFRLTCAEVTIPNNPDSISTMMPFYIPIYPWQDAITGAITAWQAATPICVDCTLRGGSLTKPSYW
jgi:hypothetical protein